MNLLANNWSLKLTALVLAVALWSHVRGEVNPLETAVFAVPLEVEGAPNFSAARSRWPTTVRVSVRAPRARMRELRGGVPTNPLAAEEAVPVVPEKLRARVDFSQWNGERALSVRATSAVEEVEILGVKPAEIAVE